MGIASFLLLPLKTAEADTVVKDVTYQEAGGVRVPLDIYLPDGSGPALVLIHGGEFHKGDKCQHEVVAQARHFAATGFVVYNIDYRLAPKLGTYSTVYECPDGAGVDISYLQGNHFPGRSS